MTSRGLRLLAYGRVSDVRGRTGESFISPEDQMRRCRDYAKTYDHTIVEEGLDLDVSGGVMSRPVLDRFLEEIKDGRAQGLIVAKLDRFSRSSRGALNALKEIEDSGGVLISVQEQIDSTTAAGRFVRAIFLATAEWERERIGESWLSAKASAVERGIHISRHVPPGYRRRADRKLEPDPVHGKTMRKAFEMATRDEPYARIAAYLNERQLPSGDSENTHWQSNRVGRLLANRVYLGEARYGDFSNEGAHAQIVDLEMWARAQRKPTSPAVTDSSAYLLTGLCRCAACLYAMRPQKARGKTISTYRCQATSVTGRCPHPSSISMSRLDEYVIEQFLSRASSYRGEQIEETDATMADAVEAERAYREILSNADLARQIGPADFAKLVSSLKDAYEDALASAPRSRKPKVAAHDFPSLVAELQTAGNINGLRDLLASGIQAVLISPAASRAHNLPISDRVQIVWDDEPALELPKRGTRFEASPERRM